jgi:hypothetical protein
MFSNIIAMFSQTLAPTTRTATTTSVVPKKSSNPFAPSEGNVFLTNPDLKGSRHYGKNMPVSGGYFAGYHNEKPNIVGRKLFIEV